MADCIKEFGKHQWGNETTVHSDKPKVTFTCQRCGAVEKRDINWTHEDRKIKPLTWGEKLKHMKRTGESASLK